LAKITKDGADKIARHAAAKWRAGRFTSIDDALAVEEPLEIRLAGRRFTLTMRTPGNDEELAAGFLLAEGFIANAEELGEIRRVRDAKGADEPNAIDVILNVKAEGLRERLKRNFTISSSCGVCGKTSIDSITQRSTPIASRAKIPASTILLLGAKLRGAQQVFAATGGLHACGLFDLAGNLLATREDIGRHNAVDKIAGWALANDMLPLSKSLMKTRFFRSLPASSFGTTSNRFQSLENVKQTAEMASSRL